MDSQSFYAIGVPGLVVILGVIGWFLVRRLISQSDDDDVAALSGAKLEQAAYRKEVHDSFAKATEKHELLESQMHALELAMANKISREEMKDIYDKIESVRQEVKGDIKGMKEEIISAIKGSK